MPFSIIMQIGGFDLLRDDVCLLSHRSELPAIELGSGTPDLEMVRGNFRIDDVVESRMPLDCVSDINGDIQLWNSAQPDIVLNLELEENGVRSILKLRCANPTANRLWLKMQCAPSEAFWGGGEQMSYLKLNGRRFPFWTSEPGVGRDKTTKLTQTMDAEGLAGGDY